MCWLFQLLTLTQVESSTLYHNANRFSMRNENLQREEIPDIWTTFSKSITQQKRENYSQQESPQKVEAFFFTEESEEEEDDKTWSTVSLSSSPRISSEGSIRGSVSF